MTRVLIALLMLAAVGSLAALWLAQPLRWLGLHPWGEWHDTPDSMLQARICLNADCEQQQERYRE
jgi:hypothetical protein